ncbi:Transcriptional activator TraM [Nitrosospira multiformis]|uniref:Transcriptional activator TraM n=1 Tax=Nitrosospira multiformis TaxID=1231 RepID=A0A1H8MP58_9PROT|nr:hypothetical protein [Nitrosospira multiformis]SEO19048.1 Transcriptional activator TraM [Nitrosospira multiformis]
MNSNEKNSLSWERDALDEIIREVAIRHGISVGRDDPILMTYTINRQVMESATGIQKMILNDYLKGLRTLSKELQDEAAGRLEQTMREATNSICLALEQEAKRLFSLQRMENEMVVRKMMEEYRHLQRFSSISFLVSFLGFATALAMLWYTG